MADIVYAIGDIHGRHDCLDDLIAQITDDMYTREGEFLVIFLGDYVDRGPDSKKVIDRLIGLREETGWEVIFLRGNHEIMMLAEILPTRTPSDTSLFYAHGGTATRASYAEDYEGEMGPSKLLSEIVPQEHIDFIHATTFNHTEGEFYFVHAGARPGIPLDKQDLEAMVWIRGEFIRTPLSWEKMVVHGHTPAQDIEIKHNRIGIDTAAFATGKLSCVILDPAKGEVLGSLQTNKYTHHYEG